MINKKMIAFFAFAYISSVVLYTLVAVSNIEDMPLVGIQNLE